MSPPTSSSPLIRRLSRAGVSEVSAGVVAESHATGRPRRVESVRSMFIRSAVARGLLHRMVLRGRPLLGHSKSGLQGCAKKDWLPMHLPQGKPWCSEALCSRPLPWAVRGCVQVACRLLDLKDEGLVRLIQSYRVLDEVRTSHRSRKSAKVTARRLVRANPDVPGPAGHWPWCRRDLRLVVKRPRDFRLWRPPMNRRESQAAPSCRRCWWSSRPALRRRRSPEAYTFPPSRMASLPGLRMNPPTMVRRRFSPVGPWHVPI